jgi:peroxiredoxin
MTDIHRNPTQSFAADAYPQRLYELTQRFTALEPQLKDSPEKQALSVLHGMIQEMWHHVQATQIPVHGPSLEDIANLYRNAPKMEGPAVSTPLPVGTPAPDFELPDANGQPVRLSDYRGVPVVLVFYPLDWSPGCSQQLDLYQQELDEFERRGAKLLAISVDSIYSHGAWAAVRGLTFPLLSDFHPKGSVTRQYQVFREKDGFADRALYVLDEDGVIRYAHVSPFVHHIPSIYDLFQVLDLLKRVEKPVVGGK